MTSKAHFVFKGFTELTSSEKDDVKKAIDKYETTIYKNSVLEEMRKSVLGPMGSGGCPCCGRG